MDHWTWGRTGLALGVTLVIGGCASRADPPVVAAASLSEPGRTNPAAAGELVIEQFLRSVNLRDLAAMSRLFGSKDGSMVELYDGDEVDGRMLALAALLKHEAYAIRGESPAPGRTDGARQFIVRMRVRGRETEVPYTLVPSEAGRWLIEQIDLERVTAR